MTGYLALIVASTLLISHTLYDLFPLVIPCHMWLRILSLGGKLVLFVLLAQVYGSLLALHQWVLTTDDQPGLAGAHGAGQMLRLTRVSHQRV